jgi:transcription initiation factor TFIID subunit 5
MDELESDVLEGVKPNNNINSNTINEKAMDVNNTTIDTNINDNNNSINDNKSSQSVNASNIDKSTVLAVLQFLRKNNFQKTETQLRKETQILSVLSEEEVKGINCGENESNLSNVLLTYKSEGDPDIYEDNYNNLKKFIESSLDSYRHELVLLLYPVFVHMYLELVYNEHEEQAIKFMNKFGSEQEYYYSEDIRKLSVVTKKEHLNANNEIINNFRSEQNLFTLRLSRDSYNYLKRFLQEKSKPNTSIFQNIIQEHLYLDVYEGLTRTKNQVESVAGGMMGEPKRDANKTKVFYGLFKEPDLKIDIPDNDIDDSIGGENAPEQEKPKKKKMKKDTTQAKKARTDPNAPPPNRIPLPELRDSEQLDKVRARKESAKALKLGPETLPSICFYTLLNAQQNHDMAALCAEISEDSTLLAAGFSDSVVRVWPLSPNKLKTMKPSSDLELIDKEVDDVLYRMMDDKNTFDVKVLHGHSGPVYSVSFSPARDLLLSCSEDATSESFI